MTQAVRAHMRVGSLCAISLNEHASMTYSVATQNLLRRSDGCTCGDCLVCVPHQKDCLIITGLGQRPLSLKALFMVHTLPSLG